MIHASNQKVVANLGTGTTASNATATLTIDRLEFDFASIAVLRASNSNTVFATVCKVEESDDNSSYANVTSLVGGGAGGFSIPAVTDTNATSILKLDVDCRNRKRYLKVSVTPSTACNVAIEARLSRPKASPEDASKAGCIGVVSG